MEFQGQQNGQLFQQFTYIPTIIMSSINFHKGQMSENYQIQQQLKCIATTNFGIFFVSCSTNDYDAQGNHWTVVIVEHLTKSIQIYDPLKIPFYDQVELVDASTHSISSKLKVHFIIILLQISELFFFVF